MPSISKPETRERQLRDRTLTTTPTESTPPAHQNRSVAKPKPREKTTMEKWVEPAVSEKPSYQEQQGVPYGVLEHMQPLGEAPSARVKTRVKAESSRKSVLGRSAAAVGVDAQETPDGTPAPHVPSPPAQVDASSQAPVAVDDAKDGDWAPGTKSKHKEKDRHTRNRTTKRRSDAHNIIKKTSTDPTDTPAPVNTNRIYDAPKLKLVVESAKKRALEVGKPDLAAAVHEIWVQSLDSARLTALLEAILTQTAAKSQISEFQDFVKQAKKKLKYAKDDTRKKPAVGGANAAPPPDASLRSPSKLTNTSTTEQETAAIPSTERPEPHKPKFSLKVKPQHKEHKDPSRRRTSHGGEMSASPSKKRSGSVGSESSLTSLTSNGDNDLDLDVPDEIAEGPPVSSNKVNGTKAKDHAAERGSLAVSDKKLKRTSADTDLGEDERDCKNAAKKQKLDAAVKREPDAAVKRESEQKHKRTSADAALSEDERDRQYAVKRQRLDASVTRDYPYEESDVRMTVKESPTARNTRTTRAQNGSLIPPPVSLPPNGDRITDAKSGRAASADVESPLSDLSPPSSQLSTPHVGRGPSRPPGKRAKTKTSPEKKHAAAGYGGLSGAGGARKESPIGDDDNEESSENSDFCSACRGGGYLLCCDGCDRSFHFACLDPPLNEHASELNEPWYCFVCVARRPVAVDVPEKPARGLFAPLLGSLRKRNPSNFELPQDIREYFEGVATDRTGSFTEAVNVKTRSRPGYDEIPDYYKGTDSKNNIITCYFCRKSTGGHRAIIKCDYCPAHWHLDCLDPPLANPPAAGLNGKKVHDWMCPLHADHELRRVDARLLNPRRRIHVRKPKNAKLVETSLKRGFRNNGVVDVLDDDSDDSDSEFYDEETQEESVVYRMPASGIKLDFIDKIKNTRVQHLQDEHVHKKARIASNAPSALQQANFARRSIVEQQLALHLTQFANAHQDLNLGPDQVENLVGTLIAEAPTEVVETMMAHETAEQAKSLSASITVPPSPPSSDQTDQLSAEQRSQLQMLQELIRRRLESSKA